MAKKIVVIGAGAWGGWTAFNLQKCGCEVTLIDQHGPGNALSGSGDLTRIIRMAYGGDMNYSALTARSFELWRKYSNAFNTKMIFDKKALWMFRGIDPAYAEVSVPLMSEMGFKLEELPVDVLKSQYPQINFKDITSAYLEHDSAYLLASESCQQVFRQFQLLGGAFVQDKVTELVHDGSQVSEVRLANGELM
ncbi:MAG TPA: FAD-dependent oxidoreductase, partial [Roseivirga sp.]